MQCHINTYSELFNHSGIKCTCQIYLKFRGKVSPCRNVWMKPYVSVQTQNISISSCVRVAKVKKNDENDLSWRLSTKNTQADGVFFLLSLTYWFRLNFSRQSFVRPKIQIYHGSRNNALFTTCLKHIGQKLGKREKHVFSDT